jgi:hypothetical protein
VRKSFAVLLLAVGVLVGYSFRTMPVEAQAPAEPWFAFNIGGTVTLSVDLPQGQITCKVTQVRNEFIGCARDDQQRQSDRWINLRFVKVITPREQ